MAQLGEDYPAGAVPRGARLLLLPAAVALSVFRPGGVGAALLGYRRRAVTAAYEVLEPETWVGKELPILEHIDIAEHIKTGTWLLLFRHHDCPDCREAIPQYEQMARDLAGSEDFLRIALIEVPPAASPELHRSRRVPPVDWKR